MTRALIFQHNGALFQEWKTTSLRSMYVLVRGICYSSIHKLNPRRQILARCREFIYTQNITVYICTNYDCLQSYSLFIEIYLSVQKVSTITSCKNCRLRFDFGIGLLLKPCICKGEEYLWIYPKVTINNDCIQHPNTEYFAVFEKCRFFFPKLAFFIKEWE